MRIQRCLPVILTALLLALAGCGDAPLTPHVVNVPEEASFQRSVGSPCTPHEPQLMKASPLLMKAIATGQHVEVDLGEYRTAPGRFRSQLQVWTNGQACGLARLEIEEPSVEGGTGIILLILRFTNATVSKEDGRTVVEFKGTAEVCSEREDECRTEEMTGTAAGEIPVPYPVFRFPTNGDPVVWQWQFYAGGIYGFPAQTIVNSKEYIDEWSNAQ